MCRNIHTLHNFDPPASSDEVHAAALQYVRKIAGTTRPSRANQEAFDEAVDAIAHATAHLLEHLTTSAPPKNREEEAAKARARGYGTTDHYIAMCYLIAGKLKHLPSSPFVAAPRHAV